jgi:hypothetical protein
LAGSLFYRKKMKAFKDQRYKAIKSLIESKGIQGLKDVFTIMPMSKVREDMKINYNTLRRRVNDGDLLTVKDIKSMAALFEVDPLDVFRLIIHDQNVGQKSKKR